MKKLNILITIFSVAFFGISCSVAIKGQTEKKNINNGIFIKCKKPRPQICTTEYNPVCATKNTRAVCVTTPCASTEDKTYSTGCTACSDTNVIKYKKGQCK